MTHTASAPTSWTLPRLGGVADEPLPGWLVRALQDRRISVNRYGGFTDEIFGTECYAGATVTLEADGTISFADDQALAA